MLSLCRYVLQWFNMLLVGRQILYRCTFSVRIVCSCLSVILADGWRHRHVGFRVHSGLSWLQWIFISMCRTGTALLRPAQTDDNRRRHTTYAAGYVRCWLMKPVVMVMHQDGTQSPQPAATFGRVLIALRQNTNACPRGRCSPFRRGLWRAHRVDRRFVKEIIASRMRVASWTRDAARAPYNKHVAARCNACWSVGVRECPSRSEAIFRAATVAARWRLTGRWGHTPWGRATARANITTLCVICQHLAGAGHLYTATDRAPWNRGSMPDSFCFALSIGIISRLWHASISGELRRSRPSHDLRCNDIIALA